MALGGKPPARVIAELGIAAAFPTDCPPHLDAPVDVLSPALVVVRRIASAADIYARKRRAYRQAGGCAAAPALHRALGAGATSIVLPYPRRLTFVNTRRGQRVSH